MDKSINEQMLKYNELRSQLLDSKFFAVYPENEYIYLNKMPYHWELSLIGTEYHLSWENNTCDGQPMWWWFKSFDGSNEVDIASLEDVLNNVPKEIQSFILMNLDLFI